MSPLWMKLECLNTYVGTYTSMDKVPGWLVPGALETDGCEVWPAAS